MCIQLKPPFSRHKGIGVQFTDEPTGNLDSKTSDEVMALLKTSAMKYEQTLIVITHNEDIAQMGNRKLVIADGKVVEQ
mgnify:CR=1 FL=1